MLNFPRYPQAPLQKLCNIQIIIKDNYFEKVKNYILDPKTQEILPVSYSNLHFRPVVAVLSLINTVTSNSSFESRRETKDDPSIESAN